MIDISTIKPEVYKNAENQIQREVSSIFSPSLSEHSETRHRMVRSCQNEKTPAEFKEYRIIVITALSSILGICLSKIKTIKSLTTNEHTVQSIINADLIHVFYKAFLYFNNVLHHFYNPSENSNMQCVTSRSVQHYEWQTRELMTSATQAPLFSTHDDSDRSNNHTSIDTPLSTFKSVRELRVALLNIANALDSTLLNRIAKYTSPGNIGSLFMHLVNSKSELLAMPIHKTKDSILEYVTFLSDSYIQSLLNNPSDAHHKVPHTHRQEDNTDKRFAIGKSMNKDLQQKKDTVNKNYPKKHRVDRFDGDIEVTNAIESFDDNIDTFGDNMTLTLGCLQGTPFLTDSKPNTGISPPPVVSGNPISTALFNDMDTRTRSQEQLKSPQYFYDRKGNVVKDSRNNKVLLSAFSDFKFDTSQKYLLDNSGKFILDSDGNPILSSDYLTSSVSQQAIAYVPALDTIYPVLQSQLGKAAYDIRGIPDTPLTFAPISGLPGRPVV